MTINECCNTAVVTCTADTSVFAVAELMRRHHVGTVIVTEGEESDGVPAGIITDRDIVIEMIALQLDVAAFTAGDVMTAPVITVRESEGLIEALRLMRLRNIRRLPVVTEAGTLYGIVTVDDLLSLLAMELSLMTGTIVGQRETESRRRRSHSDGNVGGESGATQH
jgi:CBS domain-containing protein